MHIAIDAMSGDSGLSTTIPASLKALEQWDDISISLIGDTEEIKKKLTVCDGKVSDRLSIVHASEVIQMDDSPVHALRHKKNSSMRVAINLVKDNLAQGCLSAGNTGALMATSKFVLKTIKGIERPAICTALPSRKGWVYALDLGANIDTSTTQLYQFAIMGVAMVESIENIKSPSIGLMNVGSEALKGTQTTQEAHQLLNEQKTLNYQGFVEGNDLFTGNTDVIVMGGQEGNIALKTSEGLAHYIQEVTKICFKTNILTKIAGLFCYPVLKMIKNKINPSNYNGACLLGLKSIVVKSHGNASVEGFLKAIGVTRKLIANKTHNKIEALLQK